MDNGIPRPETAVITRTDCPCCGARVEGLDGRYACALCGWVNHWTQGHHELHHAEENTEQRPAPPLTSSGGAP
ncbi:hypothetical protein [Streptomyces candidus]|uniref:Uncharacterized Zn finger protein (UPF0148 family) n=1 Tax=Streptomyces candidus TaxID=67283 RepID=A0A7X0HL09_9ACTN|nr:hypothetical protein [Streptomyces candidus]MBB6439637.1 uncharacterized Zn finger protein (UPF0148 family) [Streptomyces candidus]GHH56299.1 hypothetical protein GCM10018773_62090 [Streptomyces candidus]